ncbi:DedA family protein [Candidatus Micrarchaeota archaeon]|nr:DedA family protein [Candidatus Micrarchaeota archaeon]
MGIASDLVEWSRATFGSWGDAGLFAISFAESSFFPIPPDLLLIPLEQAHPELALWYAAVCTAGSVAGSILGYLIGVKGGRPLVEKFVSKQKIDHVEKLYERHGSLAVLLAAFTPVPYKVFTITSGIFRFSLKKMLLVSVAGRGGRFFPEALLVAAYGQQALSWIEGNFELATLAVGAAILLTWVGVRKLKQHITRGKKA